MKFSTVFLRRNILKGKSHEIFNPKWGMGGGRQYRRNEKCVLIFKAQFLFMNNMY
jgi:hypothetical protein